MKRSEEWGVVKLPDRPCMLGLAQAYRLGHSHKLWSVKQSSCQTIQSLEDTRSVDNSEAPQAKAIWDIARRAHVKALF